jgi:hypothetical protein
LPTEDCIEGLCIEREPFGVSFPELDIVQLRLRRSLAPKVEHVGGDVRSQRPPCRADDTGRRQRWLAVAGGDIENGVAGSDPGVVDERT